VTLRDTWAPTIQPEKKENQRSRGKGGNDNDRQKKSSEPLPDEQRIAFRLSKILSVEPHPTVPESFVVCKLDCGDDSPRTVVGKLPKDLIDDVIKNETPVVAVTNLKPAKIAGVESTAMLLAAVKGEGDDEKLSLLTCSVADQDAPVGSLLQIDSCEPPQPDDMLKSKGAQKVWDRVKSALKVSSDGEAVYAKDGKELKLVTKSKSSISCDLKDCTIQ
jgi:tRNA-binding EMAP/Myf-like protein